MAKEASNELKISQRIAELAELMRPLEAQIAPLQEELSRLRNHLARIRNQRQRKSNAERDRNVRLAFEYLTGSRINPAGQRACTVLGILHPQLLQTQMSARKVLSAALGLTRDRIRQILKEKPRKAKSSLKINEHKFR